MALCWNYPMIHKTKNWIKRYGLAEIFGTITALSGAWISYHLTESLVVSAFTGMLSENIGYYGTVFTQDMIQRAKKHEKMTLGSSFIVLRNMFLEFGAGEALDSTLIRPLAMYWFPVFMENHMLGILIGKIAADLAFYIPTIVSYELRKKYLKD